MKGGTRTVMSRNRWKKNVFVLDGFFAGEQVLCLFSGIVNAIYSRSVASYSMSFPFLKFLVIFQG